MSASVVVFFVWFVAVAMLGAAAIATAPRWHLGRRSAAKLQVVGEVVDESITRLGRGWTTAVAYLAGAGFVISIGWMTGDAAGDSQNAVDWPAFRWFEAHRVGGEWDHVWRTLTNIGMPRLTQAFAVAGAIFFAIVWWRIGRRWYVPAFVFVGGYALEKYTQIVLKLVVDRGHPPTTLGTFPSGGCGRVLIVYGLIIFFTLRWIRPASNRLWLAGWTLLAFLLSIQAYARIYNLEHWLTDVIGGTIFGLAGLIAMIATTNVVDRDPVQADAVPVPVQVPVQVPTPAQRPAEDRLTLRAVRSVEPEHDHGPASEAS